MNKRIWFNTILVSGGHFWVDFYINMLPALLPFLGLMWDLTNSQLALLVSAQSITTNFLQPFLGNYMDKHPDKGSLEIGILIAAIPMCLLYLAQSYFLFLLMICLAGLGAALYHPLAATRAAAGSDTHKALRISVFSSLGSLGFAISPAVAAFIVATWGLEGLLYTLVPGIVWALLMRFKSIHISTHHEISPSTKEMNCSCEKIERTTYRSLIFLSIVVVLRSWLITAASVFVPLWLVSQGTSEKTAGLYLSLYLIAGTIGGFAYSYLYPKLGQQRILIFSFVTSLAILPFCFMDNSILRLASFILLGFNLLGTNPVTIVMGQELLPSRAGLASGITMGLAFGLGGLGTTLTGIAADTWGTAEALIMTSMFLIPAIVLTPQLSKATKDIAVIS